MKVSFFTKYHEVRRINEDTLFKSGYEYEVPDADAARWRNVLKDFDAVQVEMAKAVIGKGPRK